MTALSFFFYLLYLNCVVLADNLNDQGDEDDHRNGGHEDDNEAQRGILARVATVFIDTILNSTEKMKKYRFIS